MQGVKTDHRVRQSKTRLLTWLDRLPKLEFTSGDVTEFIDDRVTYEEAWAQIRHENTVVRQGPVRGKATRWVRVS